MFVRLFELDPGLLSLFSYNTEHESAQDCLASPEFLEHVTKVSIIQDHGLCIHDVLSLKGLLNSLGPHVALQVMLVIDAAVSNLDDLHSLEDYLLNLGRKHQAVGVKTQSFAVSVPPPAATPRHSL